MQIRILEHGRIALPASVRQKLRLRLGDMLDVKELDGRIVLTPRRRRTKARILVDPITGLPVLSARPDAPVLTSSQVDEILFGEL